MSDQKYWMDCKAKKCTEYEGGNAEVEVKKDECEVRKDMMIKKRECVRIWGQVKDYRGCPVEGALVKLVKQVRKGPKCWLVGIGHTLTDCKGFYQFDLCRKEEGCTYRIIAGKAIMDRYYDEPYEDEQAPAMEEEEIPDEDYAPAEEESVDDTEAAPDNAEEYQQQPDDESGEEGEAEKAPAEEGSDVADDEYPFRTKKGDAFDPDEEDLKDDPENDPCRYFMND
jgi:hypothetical protein